MLCFFKYYMNKQIFTAIGLTLNEFKKLRFYLNLLLPLTIVPFVTLIGFLAILQNLSPRLFFINIFILFLINTFVFYFSTYKINQHITLDLMHKQLKQKNRKLLIENNERMELLMQNKTFYLGFLKYLVFLVFFSLVLMITFGISRLFYYTLIKNIIWILELLIIGFFFSYLNTKFFTKIDFYKTILEIKIIKLNWIFPFFINLLLITTMFFATYYFVYLMPLYFGLTFSLIIVLNIHNLNQINAN